MTWKLERNTAVTTQSPSQVFRTSSPVDSQCLVRDMLRLCCSYNAKPDHTLTNFRKTGEYIEKHMCGPISFYVFGTQNIL